ncbi:MAG: type IV pilus modification PilV family protein, partial [Coriobacteriia bacterium]
MRTRCRFADDGGFTLSEVIVSLGLLGVILGVTWLGFSVTHAGSKTSDRESWFSREVGAPLEQAEVVLMQQYGIDNTYPGVTPYRIKVSTDRDNDDNREDWQLVATTDHRLVVTTAEFTQTSGVYDSAPRTFALSTHNYNLQAGVPLFRFYDEFGAEITSMGDVSGNASSMVIT